MKMERFSRACCCPTNSASRRGRKLASKASSWTRSGTTRRSFGLAAATAMPLTYHTPQAFADQGIERHMLAQFAGGPGDGFRGLALRIAELHQRRDRIRFRPARRVAN